MGIYTGPNVLLHRGNESQCQIQSLQQSKNWKTIFQTSVSWKQDGFGIPISSNTDYLPKVIKKYTKELFITIKGKIYHEILSIVSLYALKAIVPTSMKESLLELKACIEPHTVIVDGFNTCRSSMDRSGKQIFQKHCKIN